MAQDHLKSMWKDISSVPKDNEALRSMLQQKNHPVLKRIRRQLIIETAAFAVLLFVYYDLFDGHKKPLYANLLMIAALLLTIGHNIMGYLLTKSSMKDENIKESLAHHLSKLKRYGVMSVSIRVLTAACLLLFFTSSIIFDTAKYWLLAGAIALFVFQLSLLSGIWMARIRRMKETIDRFSMSH